MQIENKNDTIVVTAPAKVVIEQMQELVAEPVAEPVAAVAGPVAGSSAELESQQELKTDFSNPSSPIWEGLNFSAHKEWLRDHPDHAYDDEHMHVPEFLRQYEDSTNDMCDNEACKFLVDPYKLPADDLPHFLRMLYWDIDHPRDVINDEFQGWVYDEGKWNKIEEPIETGMYLCGSCGYESINYWWDWYTCKWYVNLRSSIICNCIY
jgi:hypothetical protein